MLEKSTKSNRMTRTLYLLLKPGEALLCASNCNSSFVTMMVAYLRAADNIARPLVSRLKGPHQPVVRSRIRFSAPRSRLLACL